MHKSAKDEILEGEISAEHEALLRYSGDIACAYISNNHIPPADLPRMIGLIYQALHRLLPDKYEEDIFNKPTPTQIRKSIRPEGIISFIDGKTYKTMKRHLTSHGLDSHGYIQRYGLPENYPMVCKNFSDTRSKLAMQAGLGGSSAARNSAAEGSETKPPRPPSKQAAK